MTQLIDLGKLRFHFAGDWLQSTTYESNDIVKYGGNVYVYTYGLKTSGNLPTNTVYWALMIQGFKFRGNFSTAVDYKVGDGIAHGGKVYIAVLDSVNQTPPNTTYWSQFADGIQYEGTYNPVSAYQKNDVVVYGGSVYIAKQDTTGNDPTQTGFWDKFVEGISAKSVYNNATAYVPGDLVAYGPNIYRAKVNTTGNIPTNTTQWELLISGTKFQGTYSSVTTYYLNDLVVYGNTLYRSKQEQSNTLPTTTASWEIITGGTLFKGAYVNATAYKKGDLVTYGSNTYIALQDSTGNLPTAASYWELYNAGLKYQGVWSSLTAYKIGEVITYGGSLFQARLDNSNTNPTTTATWDKLVAGFRNKGIWASATEYGIDEVIAHGGNTYISLIPHASTAFETDLAADKWQKFNSGVRWRGTWAASTLYLKDDIIKDTIGSAYLATQDHTSSPSFVTDSSKWALFVVGGSDVLPAIQATDAGQSLTVTGNGINLDWLGATQSANVFYVAPHGVDAPAYGKNLTTPYASIRYACDNAPENSTIFVKTGTYDEQLPITIPANVAIVGDNQRTVVIEPKIGLSDDGVTLNSQATMFLMSNGSILNKMTFRGMTGWTPGGTTPSDVTTSTIKGVVVRLNPASPITHKSPYVLECSFIGSGGIGALIDGSVHATGAKTMIFHGYTVISDNGIGYWVKDGGKSEIVSCFTYYCYFGYTASGGGFIRALNGNNSYGTWGATSRGFDVNESALTGALVGQQLNFQYGGGAINVGDTVTGPTGTGIVTNVQYSADKVYVKNTTGTFTAGQALTFTSGGTGSVNTGGLENQKGFVLIVNGLTALPKPGSSISIAGDIFSYVIQSVSGTYTNSSSEIVLILAQEKPNGSPADSVVTMRRQYSQIRLTGHDFLSIGTGGVVTTNYPGVPTQPAAQGNETDEAYPGRVYYVSTDQDGNFRVGEYFRIDQATGRATLNANAFDLAGLTSLKLGSIGAQLGETINEFSSDGALSGNSNTAVPTEYAVKTYVDTKTAASTTGIISTNVALGTSNVLVPSQNAAKSYIDAGDAATLTSANSYTNTAVGGISVNELPLVATISTDKTLGSYKMTFSMSTLTLSGATVYTIAPNAYHFVLNPNGFALFN